MPSGVEEASQDRIVLAKVKGAFGAAIFEPPVPHAEAPKDGLVAPGHWNLGFQEVRIGIEEELAMKAIKYGRINNSKDINEIENSFVVGHVQIGNALNRKVVSRDQGLARKIVAAEAQLAA